MQDNNSCATGELSLREQKRQETRRRIEDAATRLVDERSFTDVTVEEICAAAGISRRTFFNYFTSKESAVLGNLGAAFSDEHTRKLLTLPSTNLVATVLDLVESMYSANHSDVVVRERRQRIANDPAAAALLMDKRRASSLQLIDILTQRLEANPDERRLPDFDVHTEAAIIASLVREALWLGMTCPHADDTRSLRERLYSAATQLTDYSKGLTW